MNQRKYFRTASRQEAGVYQLKIVLSDTQPPVWRRLLVRGDVSLGLLHAIIQVSMGWTNSHLHQFNIKNQTYSDLEFETDLYLDAEYPSMQDENKTALMKVVRKEKGRFVYEYDFGDSWQHVIAVEKIIETGDSLECVAKCIDGARHCPPEDCGGVWGYANLLEVIQNPAHENFEEMMEWFGDGFDPEEFDIEQINHYLKKIKCPHTSVDQLARILMERDGYQE